MMFFLRKNETLKGILRCSGGRRQIGSIRQAGLWTILLLGMTGLTGCRPESPSSASPSPLSLRQQIDRVLEGRSERLQVTGEQAAEIPWEDIGRRGTLRRLEITPSASAPASFAFLEHLPSVRQLHLLDLPADFPLPDLPHLFPELELLRLSGAGVDDALAGKVGRCAGLRYLMVTSPALTDSGLEALGRLPKLESLYVDCPRVTDGALERLQSTRTDLHLHW